MNTFNSSSCANATATPPDPRKHVNYTQGMVLGVDDMIQDFVYHRHQRRWLAREAVGYGALSGLKVAIEIDPAKGPMVSVAPGTALSPNGQLIRVAPRQCAALNPWLALTDTRQELPIAGVSLEGSASLAAYIVLCFRDCEVDPLPIPGEPCRCSDQTMAASRILDDFRLELRLSPPAQSEEDAIIDFVQWLRQIKIADANSSSTSLDDFLAALLQAAKESMSPPQSPPVFFYESPPQNLAIPASQLCQYLRAALRLWVSDLRPLFQAQWAEQIGGGCGCHGTPQTAGQNSEQCLLLGELDIPLLNGQVAPSPASVAVKTDHCPFVVHERMLQEMLLCGPCCGGDGCVPRTFATVFAFDAQTIRLWIHCPGLVTLSPNSVTLTIDGTATASFSVNQVDPTLNLFDLTLPLTSPPSPLLDNQLVEVAFDLQQITVDSPPRSLSDALKQEGWCFPDMADDAVSAFGVVRLPASELVLNGDAQGPTQNNVVTGIQSKPVDITTPATVLGANEPVLGYDGTNWHLATLPAAPPLNGDVTGPAAANTVARIQNVPVLAPTVDATLLSYDQKNNELTWVANAASNQNFVEHPAKQGRYLIVAAGRFNCNKGSALGPVYNKLSAKPPTGGPFLTFDVVFGTPGTDPSLGYLMPPQGSKFIYIVKGTLVAANAKSTGYVCVKSFQSKFIVVQVVYASSEPSEGDTFMLEISLYGSWKT